MDENGSGVAAKVTDAQGPAMRAYVESLLTKPAFAGSARRVRLLRYLLEKTLDGKAAQLSEYAVGLDVFDKPESFDPRIESVVRTELSRLRQKLGEYYAAEGEADPVRIEVPARSYALLFNSAPAANGFVHVERPAAPTAEPRKPTTKNAANDRGRWFLIAALCLIAAVAALGVAYWRARAAANSSVRSLVVLPFVNMSGDAKNEYLADGLTEELTNDLAQSRDLRVVARTSAFQFKNKPVDVRKIGDMLNVDAVLEGSIARTGDHIRITAQLNRSANGYHIWSREFEGDANDMIMLQDGLAREVAAAVNTNPTTASTLAGSTSDPHAHDLYLQGIFEMNLHKQDSSRKAIALFEEAIKADPHYGDAYVGIAAAHTDLIHITMEPPGMGVPEARRALARAIEIDPHNAEAHGEMADIVYLYDWDWPAAEREFRSAIENGAQSTTHSYYGWSLGTRGRFEEAHRELRIAQDLNPLGAGPRGNEVMMYMLERKPDESRRILHQQLDANPNLVDAHLILGLLDTEQQRCAAAHPNFEWAAQHFHAPVTEFGMALLSICDHRSTESRERLRQMAAGGGGGYVSPYQLAIAYTALDDKDTALSYLEKSADMHEGQILYLKYDPAFDKIRADARYVALEKRVGLEP